MINGPSKEVLAEYFKNNRLYFDSLAREYKNSDPEYYNKFIAPFYNNPFHASSEKKYYSTLHAAPGKKNSVPLAVFLMSVSILIAGVVLFMTANRAVNIQTSDSGKDADVKTERAKQENASRKVSPSIILDTLPSIQKLDNFGKGMAYFSAGDYDKAEAYFVQVPKDNIMYDEARKKLSEIRKKNLGK
ncbi:MAG: hypothetical protein PHN88_05465 [Ignavibacteria bacterium]|nr:hypothetical protein [Ignavibacteria bacterium]